MKTLILVGLSNSLEDLGIDLSSGVDISLLLSS